MNESDAKHLIFGTGPVGIAVMQELLKRGQKVKMVNRSGKGKFPQEVELVSADASDPETTRELCRNVPVVYNCTNVAYHRWLDLLPGLHTAILEGAAGAGSRLVVMENLYMYGSTNGKPMTEETPFRAKTRKGKVRAEMSRELFNAHQSGRVRAVSGRASDFFGPHVHSSTLGDQVIYPALEGKSANLLGNTDLPHTYTYIRDIGRALVILAGNENAFGKAWHIPSPETKSTREVVSMLYRLAGNELKIRTAPRILVKMMGLFSKQMRELEEMMYEFEEPFIMDDSKFRETFKFTPTSLEEALRETAEWFRGNPRTDD